MQDVDLLKRFFDTLSEEPLNVHQICVRAKLDARTVQRYLELIELVQSNKRVIFERHGLRFLVRKEKGI